MRKLMIILGFITMLILVIGCTATTAPVVEPAVAPETAVPTLETIPTITEPDSTATTMPEESPAPSDNKAELFTAEPLPTLAQEKKLMPAEPGQIIKSSPEKHPQAVDTATQDLANRLNIDESDIDVISVEMVVWSDASMGCPQPDMMYIQVPQDGLRIRLEADGQIYNYHGGGTGQIFLCETPAKNVKPTPGFGDKVIPPPRSIDE
jgi:hypothetical protein